MSPVMPGAARRTKAIVDRDPAPSARASGWVAVAACVVAFALALYFASEAMASDPLLLALLAVNLVGVLAAIWSLRETLRTTRTARLLIDAVEALPDGLCVWGRDERLLLKNRAVDDYMVAYAPEAGETLEETLHRVVPLPTGPLTARPLYGDDGRRGLSVDGQIDRRLDAHRNPGPPIERQYVDGRWFRISERRLPNGGIVSLYSDITPQKEVQRRLAEAESTFRILFENMELGIIIHRDLRPLFANVAVARLLGCERAEDVLAVDNIHEFLTPDAAARARDVVVSVDGGPTHWSGLETRVVGSDGKPRWIEGFGAPIGWEGEMARISVIIDGTAGVRAQQELDRQRRLLQQVIDVLPAGVTVKDRDLRYLVWNRDASRLFGQPAEIALGRRLSDVASPAEAARMEALDRRVVETGVASTASEFTIAAAGEARTVWMQKLPLLGADGRVEGVITASLDVTELRAAERRVGETLRMLTEISDALPMCVSVKDLDLRYIHMNESQARALDIDKAQAIGLRRDDLTTGDMPPEAAALHLAANTLRDRQVLDSGVAALHQEETYLIDGTGEVGTILSSRIPLKDASGHVKSLLSIVIDITERKRLERDLERNRKFLQTVMDHIPAGIAIKDRDMRYVLVNPDVASMAGRTPADFIGWRRSDVFGNHPGTNLEAEERQVLETGQAIRSIEFVGPNGGAWLAAVAPVMDREGKPEFVVSLGVDITERKHAEERVRESEARLDAALTRLDDALASIDEGFMLWDEQNRLAYCNRRSRELCARFEARLEIGLTAEEFYGLVFDHGYASDYSGTRATFIEGNIQRLRLPGRRTERRADDGTWLSLQARTTGLGEVASVATDITEIKNRELELVEAYRLLQQNMVRLETLNREYQDERMAAIEANRAKSQFLAHMSHELRTPLNAVNGFSEIMAAQLFGPLPPRYLDYARDIHASGRHLLSVIDDILDISRIEAGRFELEPTELDLTVEFRACVSIVKGQLADRDQSVTIAVDPGAARLRADRRAIRQVVINLLANAMKASPRAAAIELAALRGDDAFVAISVADRGHGMTAEQLEHAFDPMWQAEASLSSGRTGTGLGLTICKRLVDLHEGTIGIRSELAGGTTVTVQLPVGDLAAGTGRAVRLSA